MHFSCVFHAFLMQISCIYYVLLMHFSCTLGVQVDVSVMDLNGMDYFSFPDSPHQIVTAATNMLQDDSAAKYQKPWLTFTYEDNPFDKDVDFFMGLSLSPVVVTYLKPAWDRAG